MVLIVTTSRMEASTIGTSPNLRLYKTNSGCTEPEILSSSWLPSSRSLTAMLPWTFSWLSVRRSCHVCSSSTLPVYLFLLFLFCLSPVRDVTACYKFPPGVRNPCEGKVCTFGAECMPSMDGAIARCQCPSDCPSYGDSMDSKPVCGNDGNDYANLCTLRKSACEKLQDIRVKYYGKCGRFVFRHFVYFVVDLTC